MDSNRFIVEFDGVFSENDGNPIDVISDALAVEGISANICEVESNGDKKRFLVEYSEVFSDNQIDVLADELACAVVSGYIYDADGITA